MSFRFFPWMRLSWVVRNKRHSAFCFYGFQPLAKSAPASAHSPLERIILFSHAHKVNKKRKRTSLILFLFTLDAIRTHDLPLRRRLLYPAELPGLAISILSRKIFHASRFNLDCNFINYFNTRFNRFLSASIDYYYF